MHPQFRLYLWDHLSPQAPLTLNTFHISQLNAEPSAYEQVYGIYNFEQTPLAPLGRKAKIHENPHKQLTYAFQSLD